MADEGTPEDFARMFGALRGADNSEPAETIEPPTTPPDREAIADRHGIPQLEPQLVGETAEELEADAAAKAALLQVFSPSPLKVAAHEAIVRGIHGTEETEGDV